MEAGLKRWEIGEIASRIAQLYYFQYQRTSDSLNLVEAYVFYEAILTREYFRDPAAVATGAAPDPPLANKQLRFFARFLIVCLVLGRRDMVSRLAHHLRTLVDESRRSFQVCLFSIMPARIFLSSGACFYIILHSNRMGKKYLVVVGFVISKHIVNAVYYYYFFLRSSSN